MSVVKFAQLPADFQNAISTTAGVVLNAFDPSAPGEASAIQQAIQFATSGGVNVSCKMTYKDYGADVDNCPKNTKELAEVESVECMMSGTGVTVTSDSAASMIGPADNATASDLETVTPRMHLKQEDFKPLWYVCPYGTQGGWAAVELANALSEGGFSWQSTDKEKGKFAFSYRGYSSLEAPDVVPFKFYLKKTDTAAVQQLNAA